MVTFDPKSGLLCFGNQFYKLEVEKDQKEIELSKLARSVLAQAVQSMLNIEVEKHQFKDLNHIEINRSLYKEKRLIRQLERKEIQHFTAIIEEKISDLSPEPKTPKSFLATNVSKLESPGKISPKELNLTKKHPLEEVLSPVSPDCNLKESSRSPSRRQNEPAWSSTILKQVVRSVLRAKKYVITAFFKKIPVSPKSSPQTGKIMKKKSAREIELRTPIKELIFSQKQHDND
jgi:hypothetical protein